MVRPAGPERVSIQSQAAVAAAAQEGQRWEDLAAAHLEVGRMEVERSEAARSVRLPMPEEAADGAVRSVPEPPSAWPRLRSGPPAWQPCPAG